MPQLTFLIKFHCKIYFLRLCKYKIFIGEVTMSSYTEYKKRVLQNPEIKAEYDAFGPYSKYSPFEKREEISNTTTFNARTNSDIKQQCAPFDICIEQTNNDTITAMLEAENIAHAPSTKRYSNVEDALRVLKE